MGWVRERAWLDYDHGLMSVSSFRRDEYHRLMSITTAIATVNHNHSKRNRTWLGKNPGWDHTSVVSEWAWLVNGLDEIIALEQKNETTERE